MHFFVVLILNTGGEGLKHSLHIPGVYFKRFLPVSNLVSLDFSRKCWVTFTRLDTVISGRLPARPITRTGRLLHTGKKKVNRLPVVNQLFGGENVTLR